MKVTPLATGSDGPLDPVNEAVGQYARILAQNPNNPAVLNMFGVAMGQTGRAEDAVKFFKDAVDRDPTAPEFHHNHGLANVEIGHLEAAIGSFLTAARLYAVRGQNDLALEELDRAREISPNSRDGELLAAQILLSMGRSEEASSRFNRLALASPVSPDIMTDLGNINFSAGRFPEAIRAYTDALTLKDDHFPALTNLSLALHRMGRHVEAESVARRALEIVPNAPVCLTNLGIALHHQGRYEEAELVYKAALLAQPDALFPRWNLGMTQLLRGNLLEGWSNYDTRLKIPDLGIPDRQRLAPLWLGQPPEALQGPLLVWAEQGWGDTIQFTRYVKILAEQDHELLFEVDDPLYELMRQNFSGARVRVIRRQESPLNLEGDVRPSAQIPLLSLAKFMAPTIDAIANSFRPLAVDLTKVARWRGRLQREVASGNRLIGLAWTGRETHPRNTERSVPVEELGGLQDLDNVTWVNLQLGDTSRPLGLPLLDYASDLTNFDETAALMCGLDAVVTVDTAIAHLCGSLGRTCHLMLPVVPDWRWLETGRHTPWYPSVELHRREIDDADWSGVLCTVVESLRAAE